MFMVPSWVRRQVLQYWDIAVEPSEVAHFGSCHVRWLAPERRGLLLACALCWCLAALVEAGGLVFERPGQRAGVTDVLLLSLRVAGCVLLWGVYLLCRGGWFEHDDRRASGVLFASMAFLQLLLSLRAGLDNRSAMLGAHLGWQALQLVAVLLLHLRWRSVAALALCGVAVPAALAFGAWQAPPLRQGTATPSGAGPWTWGETALTLLLLACSLMLASGLQERHQRLQYRRMRATQARQAAFAASTRLRDEQHLALRHDNELAEQRQRTLLLDMESRLAHAEQRDRDKSQFLAVAVHDLRQPLQAIGHVLEPARRALEANQSQQAREMVELAAQATQRMRSLLGDVLELSRLQSGFVQAKLERVDLLALCHEVVEPMRAAAEAQGVRLAVEWQGAEPTQVRTDRHFLTRILLNLVSNGIKYRDNSKSACEVRLHLLPGPAGHLRLEVRDNGIGIDPTHVDSGQLFAPFHQLGGRGDAAENGVGLGLSIVSAMSQLLPDHQLQVESLLGLGTCMRLVLPLADGDTAVAGPRQLDAELGTVSLRGLYVMVVEDDALVRKATVALLESMGSQYESAASVPEAVAVLSAMERAPDVLLCDLTLGGGTTGLDVARHAHGVWGPLPLVVMSGQSWTPTAEDGISPYAVLAKPVEAAELIRVVAAAAQTDTAASPGAAS